MLLVLDKYMQKAKFQTSCTFIMSDIHTHTHTSLCIYIYLSHRCGNSFSKPPLILINNISIESFAPGLALEYGAKTIRFRWWFCCTLVYRYRMVAAQPSFSKSSSLK